MARMSIGFALVVLVLAPAALAEPPPRVGDEAEEPAVTTAQPDELKKLQEDLAAAEDSEDAIKIRDVLRAIAVRDNPEFLDVGKEYLSYRASREDRKAVMAVARELGIRKAKRIKQMVAEREQEVQREAAKILSRYKDDEEVGKILHKALMDKNARDDKPAYIAQVIESMGWIGYTDAYDEIESLFRKATDKEIMRAAVICFGLTKEKRAAKMLCDHIDEPAPANVNSGTNPPSSYWEARWNQWDYIRRQVGWALKEITGVEREFMTGKQARDWIREHGREIGIR
jgi:hypothetical protein